MTTHHGENRRQITNVVVLVISFVIIAAVVISVVVVADGPGKDELQSTLNGTIASLDTVCGYTDYKETCKSTLAPVGHGNRSEVTIYFRASVNATLVEMRRAKGISEAGAKKAASNYIERYTLEDCMQLLDLGIDQLNYILAMVPESDLLTTKSDDVRNSLSAVVSYQQTCIEGLVVTKSKSKFDKDLQKSIELASNSLAIIYEYSDNDDKKGEAKKTRRLLSIAEEDNNDEEDNVGYPTWMSAADRRLLESKDVVVPHAVVAQDGTGQYDTISEALKAYPKNLEGRYIIYVKSGQYRETVILTKETTQVFMYGDGPSETVVIGRWKNTTVYRSATFSVVGKGFICKHMGFTSAGYRPDKVALRVQSDQSAFFNCSIDGSLGPLYAVANRQFYRQCNITGNSQIIRGDSTVMIQNSQFIVKKPKLIKKATITAHARSDRHESTGFVLHNCSIVPDEKFKPERLNYSTYLGEPLGKYSRTVVMESMLGDFIHPEGWLNENVTIGVDTVNFLEYKNSGPGAQTNKRVKWPGYREIKDKDEAMRYSAGRFIQIEKWLTPDVKLPYQAGLYT